MWNPDVKSKVNRPTNPKGKMKQQNTIEEKPTSNSFMRVMQDFRAGASLDELSEGLQELVSLVKDTGKGGSIVYTIKVKPASKGIGFSVLITDDVNVKLPKLERDSGIFYATDDNNLVRENPAQKNLDLKVVPAAEPAPLKEARA